MFIFAHFSKKTARFSKKIPLTPSPKSKKKFTPPPLFKMIKINTPRPTRMRQESHPYETTVPSVWDKNPKRLGQESQAYETEIPSVWDKTREGCADSCQHAPRRHP